MSYFGAIRYWFPCSLKHRLSTEQPAQLAELLISSGICLVCTCERLWFCCTETVWSEWDKNKTMGESCTGISLCQNQTTIFFLWSARCYDGILAAGDHMATDSRLIRAQEDQTVSQIRLRVFTCVQHCFILLSFLQVFDNVCYRAQP